MQEQPFYIGQKVVCINPDKDNDYKKGVVYTVKELIQCSKCSQWMVGAIEHNIPFTIAHSTCPICGTRHSSVGIYWRHCADNFRPVHEGFESISFTKVLEEELVSVN